jgi:hypothetical protein
VVVVVIVVVIVIVVAVVVRVPGAIGVIVEATHQRTSVQRTERYRAGETLIRRSQLPCASARQTKSAVVVLFAVTTTVIVPAHDSAGDPACLASPPITEYEPGGSVMVYSPSAPTLVVRPFPSPWDPGEKFRPPR